MPGGSEVGIAYVTLAASAKGLLGDIQQEMNSVGDIGDKAGGEMGRRFGGGFKTLAIAGIGAAVAGVGAAVAGVVKVAKLGFDEMSEASGITAQLEAGIKSTGNAANVTVEGMNELAATIQGYSGQTDDSIAKTQSLLMTFTNIKNVGADKIFDQATIAAADMAAKMGGDAASQAMQLGKALNDPVKGVTALTRMGVQLTDAQKDQIKVMVESGDVMGAQKIILGELTTQFGGAAKAAGQALPGQLERLKRSFEDVAQGAMEQFLPAIQSSLGWLLEKMPAIGDIVGKVFTGIGSFFSTLGQFIGPVIEKVKESGLSFGELGNAMNMLNPVLGLFKEFWPTLMPLLMQVADVVLQLAKEILPLFSIAWQMVIDIVGPILQAILGVVMDVFPTIMSIIQTVMDALLPLIKGVLDIIQKVWDEHGTEIMRIVTTVFAAIGPVIEAALKIIQGIIQVVTGLISGDWDEVWTGIKNFFSGIWDGIRAYLNYIWEVIKGIFKIALEYIKAVWDAAWGAVKLVFTNIWNGIKSVAQSIWDSFKNAFSAMWDAMKGIWDAAAGWIGAIPGKIKAFFTGAIDWLKKFGEDIINGLWNGLKSIWDTVSGWFTGLGGKVKDFFSNAGEWLKDAGKAIIQGLWDGMKAIWDGLTGWVGDLGGWIADLKGPLDKDKVLLYEQGNVIIGGLARGMKSALPQVEGLLTDLTGNIGGEFAVSGPMGAGSGGHRVNNINIVVHINGQGAAAGEQAVNVITRRLATLGV